MSIDADRILQVVKAVMPAGALVQVAPGTAHLNLGVSWKLNNDPARPSKMSKTIRILVSHEAAQDFEALSAANQTAAYARVRDFLLHKLASFDPNHNAPRDTPPPVETWVISTDLLTT